MPTTPLELVRAALAALGVRDLALGVHDPSFPCHPDEDLGRGTPYGAAAAEFLRFARDLGFDGVQLGPQGRRPPMHPSPYDGALFARDPLAVSALRLTSEEYGRLLAPESLAALVAARPPGARFHADYAFFERAQQRLLAEAFATFEAREAAGEAAALRLAGELRVFAARQQFWLESAVLFDALAEEHGDSDPTRWSASALDERLFDPPPGVEAACAARRAELTAKHRTAIRFATFCQYLAHAQHARHREDARALGLRLFADLQIGMGPEDRWAWRAHFLPGYALGAPPSRTNPEGQPWHYPVLDPAQLGTPAAPGPALLLVMARLDKLFAEFDAVRIDHPHGLVCPWVYRSDGDPGREVLAGARLTDSPALPDHPELARFAIARPDQLSADLPRHADGWVRWLDDEQVERYAVTFDAIVATAQRQKRATSDLVCEVLSTQPYPLARVMERHGLGRFRVTQKASLADPRDVYRSENARPEDWIMIGNHDTEPIWTRLGTWAERGELPDRAAYLAERLVPDERARPAFRSELLRNPGRFAQAQFADLFASPAEHVMVFFSDLFGISELYNRPGTVSAENWNLRLPADYADLYRRRLADGSRALDLPAALALALRARPGAEPASLAEPLERLASAPRSR